VLVLAAACVDDNNIDYDDSADEILILLLLLRHYKDMPQPQPQPQPQLAENLGKVLRGLDGVLVDTFVSEKRDECVRILLELGAPFPPESMKLVCRIIREARQEKERLADELDQMRRSSHVINEAVVLMALEHERQVLFNRQHMRERRMRAV
jgi:hypothetical protein